MQENQEDIKNYYSSRAPNFHETLLHKIKKTEKELKAMKEIADLIAESPHLRDAFENLPIIYNF